MEIVTESYRFLLYNIRYGTGSGWKFHTPVPFSGYMRKSADVFLEIADFVKSFSPDIVGLVEVDGGSVRSDRVNQAEKLASDLGHYFVFETKYSKPLLTRFAPIVRRQGNALLVKNTILSQKYHYFEWGIKRLIIEIELENVVLFLVHLSIHFRKRQKQLVQLSRLINSIQKPVVVSGDFNIFLGQRELARFLAATKLKSANTFNMLTYPSGNPRWELDFIFHSDNISIDRVHVPSIRLSDHLPLVCDFSIEK
ncbi:MAG: endonuclease/exonuclease/phosphatase family protein [Desulfobacteraceae bacterium]